MYHKWSKLMDPAIQLIAVELAGRGKRIHEALYGSVEQMIEDVFGLVEVDIKQSSYAFFGHSMGAMIAYLLAQKIRHKNRQGPIHVFLSARHAPHVQRGDAKKYHLMDDFTFKKELISLGGTPPEFFEDARLTELFLPLLRNDFMLSETPAGNDWLNPLDCAISVFSGKKDDLTIGECEGWHEHSKRGCKIHYFEGGHFFLNEEAPEIVRRINETLISSGNIYGVSNNPEYERR